MASAKERFFTILKDAGYSRTAARSAVFEALLGQEPLSMAELVSRAPSVDRASVYRAVELFEQLGIVQRLHIGWKYKLELTERFSYHHHHLTCMYCERMTPINEARLEAFIEQLTQEYGFVPKAHQIEIQGICRHCQIA